MIYESKARRQSFGLKGPGHIQFEPNADKFGELDSESAIAKAEAVRGPREIEQAVEASEAFRTGIVGVHGVWRKQDRLASVNRASVEKASDGVYRGMSDKLLRAHLGEHHVAVPMNAGRDQLVKMCMELTTVGKVTTTAVEPLDAKGPEVAPGPEPAADPGHTGIEPNKPRAVTITARHPKHK